MSSTAVLRLRATPTAARASRRAPSVPPGTRSLARRLGPLVVGLLSMLMLLPGTAVAADTGPIPVSAADPSAGSALAPVTIVYFGDYQCPFCRKAMATMAELRKRYGAQRLRVVYKNFPLDFHKGARPAAEMSVAVHQAGGNAAFARFHDAAFDAVQGGGSGLDAAVAAARIDASQVQRVLATGAARKKVDDDIALGRALGVRGTPAFFVNGRLLSGAQSVEKFAEAIDAELQAATAAGLPAGRVYVERTKANFAAPAATPPAAAPSAAAQPVAATTVHRVPLGNSASKGNAGAPVTLVAFSDFQCPFCGKAATTLQALEQKYGSKLRIVYKHNPLAFHARAEPAAELALEVRARKGDAGFWAAHDRLFAQQRALEDADLAQVATDLGLDAATTMQAVAAHKHRNAIQADQDLAGDLGATGTPTFFVNGRMLRGARPASDFEQVIDEELAHAALLAKQGVSPDRVYAAIQKTALIPAPLPKKAVSAPGAGSPSRGPRSAPVVVQVFGDFQCPACSHTPSTLEALEKSFPGQIRVVWRNMPLAVHPDARPAARLALEAFRQKGDPGFWKMHDLLYQSQSTLDRATLLGLASQVGLSERDAIAALDTTRHDAAIDADLAIAQKAAVDGTPAFVVNGYYLGGAEPAKLARLVRAALADLQQAGP